MYHRTGDDHMSPTVLAIALGLVFVAVAIAFFWQESSDGGDDAEYVVNDVVSFVAAQIPDIGTHHVKRIVEAEVFYLQGLVDDPDGFRPIAGSPAAMEFVAQQALKAGFKYDPQLIELVMALEAEYLVSIGAVGNPVGMGDS